jgi:hypothetical protein
MPSSIRRFEASCSFEEAAFALKRNQFACGYYQAELDLSYGTDQESLCRNQLLGLSMATTFSAGV